MVDLMESEVQGKQRGLQERDCGSVGRLWDIRRKRKLVLSEAETAMAAGQI